MILTADVGGTKTVVALYDTAPPAPTPLHERTYASADYDSLEAVLARFLEVDLAAATGSSRPALRSACFGVAGAVVEGRCQTTNLPWELDESALADAIGAPRVKLLNDLEAAAYGMLFLPDDRRALLSAGTREEGRGNIAVIAAGTGLGEAMLYWDGSQHHPVASEGSHADFGPNDDEEVELLRFLRNTHGPHVSWERVVSGPGLFDLYRFHREQSAKPEPEWLGEAIASGDPSAAISQAGLEGRDEVCTRTLERFASIYGAEAGNLALRCLALGGVVVGGGIAPKLLPALQTGAFLRRFVSKGRFRGMLESLPVHVSLEPRAPLIGCVHYALRP